MSAKSHDDLKQADFIMMPENTGIKRKADDNESIENKKPCLNAANDALEPNSSAANDEKCKSEKNILNCGMKNNMGIDAEELHSVLEEVGEKIDAELMQKAQKNKLTITNVKNILRHIITNEYVLAMVRNTMKAEVSGTKDLEPAVFEPKLTRAKAKALKKKQPILSWPVSSPVKQSGQISKKLLEEEFSDESSDEDYKPTEEEFPSEEDDAIFSPKPFDLESCQEVLPAPLVSKLRDDEDALVIALPETENEPLSPSEVDKIALRTRSKLCLNDTPLEAIEASFIAPDITVDMYDTKCDDEEWQTFLRELTKPIDSGVVTEQTSDEPDADDADDPEYNVLEEREKPDAFDLLDDDTVKITRDELNALVSEILESAEQERNECDDDDDDDDDEDDDDDSKVLERIETPCVTGVGDVSIENVRSQWMNSDERLQLDEQMRMYVQLLTQSYLLSYGIPELNFINISAKIFLDEIKMFASREIITNSRSAFYSHNLDAALDIVNEYENRQLTVPPPPKKSSKVLPSIHLSQVKQTLINSKVFIYPELLPSCGFHRHTERHKFKTKFSAAEDNLIAMGLEQFSFTNNPVKYVQSLLLPTKTEYQIKIRIKNSKSPKTSLDNPIKHYLTFKQAPQYQRLIRIFDPENVKAPKDFPPDVLPEWMKPHSKCVNTAFIAPSQVMQTNGALNGIHPAISKPPERRRYVPILPRGVRFSPLKQVTLILKKYNQHRRSFNFNSPRKYKHVNFSKQVNPLIRPKSIDINTDVLTQKSEINNMNKQNIELEALLKSTDEVGKEIMLSEQNVLSKQDTINIPSSKDTNFLSNYCPSSNTCIAPITQTETLQDQEFRNEECPSVSKSIEADTPLEVEIGDEADEEVMDDEQDLAALMAASSTICKKQQSVNKKRNRIQRDLESSLALLKPNLVESDPKKEEREVLFANSYLLRVAESLKNDPETYEKFLKALCKYQYNTKSPVQLYFELKEILKDHPALVDDFIAFLRPEQAKDCGKYKEFTVYSKIREFLRKVEVHFSNQPQHLLRVLRTVAQLRQQTDLTSAEVLNALQPLLRNQSHLMEELTLLLPDVSPSEYLMTDFEEVTIPNSEEDNSSIDSCEEITIPDAPDPYGGKECPCDCHLSSSETRVLNRSKHCVKCSIKFIDGRIYVQTGKVLKPAQVTYHEPLPESVKDKNNQQTCSKNKHCDAVSAKVLSVLEPSNKAELSKKDNIKRNGSVQQPVISTDEMVPSSSKLPCDVIEDTVFPAVTSSAQKSAPSDFSHLRDMIGYAIEKNRDCISNEMSKNMPLSCSNESESAKKDDNLLAESGKQNLKWTRDEDKLIVYNCQRYGISKKAFLNSASLLESKTAEEVEERFIYLMKLLSREINRK